MGDELLSTEKCGVIGMVGTRLDFLDFQSGFGALQHRGGDAAGYVAYARKAFFSNQRTGSIEALFAQVKRPAACSLLIGHNRYTTSSGITLANAQPFLLTRRAHTLVLAHNGNIPHKNRMTLERQLKKTVAKHASDSRVLALLLLESRNRYVSWSETFASVLPMCKGAFSLVCATDEGWLYGIRDPWGIRPLCIGKKDAVWVIASETTALEAMGASYMREVLPGEIVCIKPNGEMSSLLYATYHQVERRCLLETVYFSKNRSFDGRSHVWEQRRTLGRGVGARFMQKNIPIDVVVPILNSGKEMAVGVSEVLGIVNTEAIKISGAKRSFIQNTDEARKTAVHQKHIVSGALIVGKRIALCDDSLVRGVSLNVLIAKIRDASLYAPKEIHVLLGSPPVVDICDLGVDLPKKKDLLAAQINAKTQTHIEKKIARLLGVKSVTYLDIPFVEAALGRSKHHMCWHCFGGPHPLRDGVQPIYRVHKHTALKRQRLLFLASGNGTNVLNLLREVKHGRIAAKVVGLITNRADAGVIKKVHSSTFPVDILPSKGKLHDSMLRRTYEEDLLSLILVKRPDVIILSGWMIVLSDELIQAVEARGTSIINLHPALLSGNGSGSVKTSMGVIPEVRGAHAIEQTYEMSLDKMPVAGVTVHRVVPGGPVDTGEILLKEEVMRIPKESLDDFTARMHSAEFRVFPLAVQRVLLNRI